MKYILFLFCFCFLGGFAQGQNTDQEWTRSYNDPIELMEQVIEKQPTAWQDATMNTIFTSYAEEGVNDAEYIFLQSPGLGTDFFQMGTGDVGNFISKERFLTVLKDAMTTAEKASIKLARATVSESLREYEIAFELAQKFMKNDSISYQEAIEFLDNRFGYIKLEHAKTLMDKSNAATFSQIENKNNKARAKIEELDKTYFDKLPLVTALLQLKEFYAILSENKSGLAVFPPYTAFKNRLDYLNKLRIDERRRWKSTITVTYPTKNSVLSVENPMDITWVTSNIDANKSIRFFLVKNDMMVQELGVFKNKKSVSGIQLERNIEPGDNFKIMAIELFPDDKFQIAKFVTPAFSIRKQTRKDDVAITKRTEFAGRKISYVKELMVNSKDISVEIWDNKEQDGDVVSVYLNGNPIIANYSLTKERKLFQLQLDGSKSNDIFLFAHNLGTIPPNTVSIEISDGSSSEKIVLNSDLSSCEAVLIKVK